MPFELVERVSKPSGKPRIGALEVAVTTATRPHAQHGRLVVLFFGDTVSKRLNWKRGTKVSIYWGSGADLGKVRVEPYVVGVSSWELKGGTPQSQAAPALHQRGAGGLPVCPWSTGHVPI